MAFIRLILLFSAFALPAYAGAAKPVILQGDSVAIVHDGSAVYYDPHTEAGRLAIQESRGVCCVEAPEHWHGGETEAFALKGDITHDLTHESLRLVVNPRTGAFISITLLEDTRYKPTDPHHYVDADTTALVALTPEQITLCSCKPGDRIYLSDVGHHQNAWAVYGANAGKQEAGASFIGISAGAAAALHIPVNPVSHEAMDSGYKLTMTIYPGSGYGARFPHGPIPPITNWPSNKP